MPPFESMAYGGNGQYFTVQTDALNAFMVALSHLADRHNISVDTPTLEQVGPDFPTITIKLICYPPYPSARKPLPTDMCANCGSLVSNLTGVFAVSRHDRTILVGPCCVDTLTHEGWKLSGTQK